MLNLHKTFYRKISILLTVLTIAAITFAGPILSHSPPAFGESLNPVETKEDSSIAPTETDIDLSLPNIGLKDPDDIKWPGGEILKYEYATDLSTMFATLPGITGEMTIESENNPFPDGGEMKDSQTMISTSQGIRTEATIELYAEYDQTHRVKSLGVTLGMKIRGSLPIPMKIPDTIISYKGELRDGKLIEDVKGAPMMGIQATHSERDVPDDGFFFCSGSGTPGLTALMLSALDIEDGDTATVWLVNPSFQGLGISEPGPGFIRASTTRLDRSHQEIRDFWDGSRQTFDNWIPPEGVKTYATYEETDNIDSRTVFFSYIDNNGKVIRIETIFDGEPITVNLQKAHGTSKAWWGRERD
jgi:hypothetical protein